MGWEDTLKGNDEIYQQDPKLYDSGGISKLVGTKGSLQDIMRAIDVQFGVKSELLDEIDANSGEKSRDGEHRLGGIIFQLPIYVISEKEPNDDEFTVKFFKIQY